MFHFLFTSSHSLTVSRGVVSSPPVGENTLEPLFRDLERSEVDRVDVQLSNLSSGDSRTS